MAKVGHGQPTEVPIGPRLHASSGYELSQCTLVTASEGQQGARCQQAVWKSDHRNDFLTSSFKYKIIVDEESVYRVDNESRLYEFSISPSPICFG